MSGLMGLMPPVDTRRCIGPSWHQRVIHPRDLKVRITGVAFLSGSTGFCVAA